jgi:hypothetical protein
MKLYTEEQVRKAWNTAFSDALRIDEEDYKPTFYGEFINGLTPIELPSDDDDMLKIAPSDTANPYEIGFIYGFDHGAKCVINYIKEQYNTEHIKKIK